MMAKKIEAYSGQKQSGILLNANESSENLPQDIIQEILHAVENTAFNRYPDTAQIELRKAYAKAMGLQTEQVLAGNGSDQMLGLLIGMFLGKGKSLYTYDPDFSMYEYYASSYEADVEKYALPYDGSLDIESFIQHGREKKVSLVMFSNPNNPTGNCLSIEQIRKIIAGFAPVPVVIDEAYFEFSDETSALTLLADYDNLYVTRTLSKAYGLAGVRLGFLISSVKNMAQIIPSSVPYALNSISMKIGTIVLSHADQIQKRIAETKDRRNEMYARVKKLRSIQFYPSQANFLHGCCDHKEELLAMFAKENIVIRNYQGKNTFRITIGNAEENEKVWQVLKKYEEEFA
jgi:histidinol-phosphate aminotransferase